MTAWKLDGLKQSIGWRLVTGAGDPIRIRGVRVRRVCGVLIAVVMGTVTLCAIGVVHDVYFDRRGLPDIGPFARFELPSIGRVYDANGQPLIELARERRQIMAYADIPPVVREAILSTEDKRFFSHSGVDYLSGPRIMSKVRLAGWGTRLVCPQGGSTITQQVVRGVFLEAQTSQENSAQLRNRDVLPRLLSWVIGARNTNMLLRKREEIRLSVWLEQQMRDQFGSKQRAKEEILARYASFVYMGHGQYGFASAAQYYFGRSLSSFTVADAGLAAELAGIMKAPRDYAPSAKRPAPILRRRNQILALMADQGFLTPAQLTSAQRQPLPATAARTAMPGQSSAVLDHVLNELRSARADLGVDDLLEGRIQVYSTVDARVQKIATDALEHGLAQYESRHPTSVGIVQGSVVVLSNRDGSILAEAGGRQVYRGRATLYSDLNRVRRSLRQPGSTMKPMVYLAAFESGDFSLDTLVPDAPISVPNGNADPKWVSNYDGQFKGLIPLREALAESRNAVAIWITSQIGIDAVLKTSRGLGVKTPLHRYATTALGASEVNLLELATAYRTIASGVLAQPFVIRRIATYAGDAPNPAARRASPVSMVSAALSLIQEGLRGVVRIPTGTAHALDAFPIPVMGKTGTTNDFRDALFVGSTFGLDGITVAIRIGFDDNRTLGERETGGRVALPVFQELMLKIYHDKIVGPPPAFPPDMEQRITLYLRGDATPGGSR